MHPNNTANAVSSNKGLNISEHMPPSNECTNVHTSPGSHEVS